MNIYKLKMKYIHNYQDLLMSKIISYYNNYGIIIYQLQCEKD